MALNVSVLRSREWVQCVTCIFVFIYFNLTHAHNIIMVEFIRWITMYQYIEYSSQEYSHYMWLSFVDTNIIAIVGNFLLVDSTAYKVVVCTNFGQIIYFFICVSQAVGLHWTTFKRLIVNCLNNVIRYPFVLILDDCKIHWTYNHKFTSIYLPNSRSHSAVIFYSRYYKYAFHPVNFFTYFKNLKHS